MEKMVITVGELERILNEEANNEFKPVVFGDKESAKINREAYADIKKETEKYDGGLSKDKKKLGGGINATDNKGMHDLAYDNISEPFKDRVKSQMKGYVSKDAEDKHKNDEFGNATFDKDGNMKDITCKEDIEKDRVDKEEKIMTLFRNVILGEDYFGII